MPNNTHHILQQVILLATGVPGSERLRADLLDLYQRTDDWSPIAAIVDDYMNSLIPNTANGVTGLIQAVARNGLGLVLSDQEAEQVTQDLIGQGIDSWSKLFTFVITELTGDLATVLNHRATAAEQFTDLLAHFGKDHFSGEQTLEAARTWVQSIGASVDSLTAALTQSEQLIQRFTNNGTLNPESEPTPAPSPEPTPSPEPAPNPEPTPEPTPSPEPAPNPEPTPAPSPEPAPSPSPSPAPVSTPTRTVTVNANGTDDAGTAHVTYNIAIGTYTYTINGFNTGDVLNFPQGALQPSVINDDYTDALYMTKNHRNTEKPFKSIK
ncbi:MAG: hypothetical protein U1D70_19725 [Methylobacter sp.]|nr:hypothetical protein [Methylobacter sp.]MDP2427561.1 hypothetical protein [Methylobacter sp.]MDP3055795.1 hypothetical protein [Methylobacter sp.]MDZ4221238.1 hypothetical protein [Methylobacter sp.]